MIADRDRDDVAFGHIGPRRYGQPFSTHRHLGNIRAHEAPVIGS
jgi:hypothetical protein